MKLDPQWIQTLAGSTGFRPEAIGSGVIRLCGGRSRTRGFTGHRAAAEIPSRAVRNGVIAES